MKQPIKKKPISNKTKKASNKKKTTKVIQKKGKEEKPKYGTSKLEKDFACNFLDKYGIQYIYEFEAKDIKRYYDFAVITKKSKYITEEKEGLKSIVQGIQHTPIDFLIEIDGSFWHSDPRFVDETKLTVTQKHNKMVDEIKNKWARLHGIPLVRIWEYDIRHNEKKVLEELGKYVELKSISKPKEKPKRVMKIKRKP